MHQILEPMKFHHYLDNEKPVRRTQGRLAGAPVSITVYVRFAMAAWFVRCRDRAPRPRMRMGSQL